MGAASAKIIFRNTISVGFSISILDIRRIPADKAYNSAILPKILRKLLSRELFLLEMPLW